MKKTTIASLVALLTFATVVNAAEFGATIGRDYSGADRNTFGVTLGKKFNDLGATVGVDHAYKGNNDQNRFTLMGSYDFAKFGFVTLSSTAGVAYLDNQKGSDGFAALGGLGVSLPLAKNFSATADVRRQFGQDRVKAFDGNTVTVGLKSTF